MTNQSPRWADAKTADRGTEGRDLPPRSQAEIFEFPHLIHHVVRPYDWANYHEPPANFDPHWAQVQLALAALLWGIVAVIVGWLVS
jgi:hypothetical protein